MKKRLLAFFMAFVMVLGLLPMHALAWVGDEDYQIVSVEKYDAEGNGTFLLAPTRVAKTSAYYLDEWLQNVFDSDIEIDDDSYDVTGYVDSSQDDGWLNNGDMGDSSKWLVWLRATNKYGVDRRYTNPSAYTKISALDMVRILFTADGAEIDMTTVNKEDLVILVSGLTEEQKESAATAYQAALDVILNKAATQTEVDAAEDALDAAMNPERPAVAILLSPTSVNVNVGQTQSVTATLETASGKECTDTVAWSIADESIATVDANGIVTGVAVGSTTLTARANETVYQEISVNVSGVAATGISVAPTAVTVEAEKTAKITATLEPAESFDTVAWSVEDDTIATVDQQGVVTGVAEGTTKVIASVNGYTAECTVTVTPARYVYFDYADDRADQRMAEDGSFTLSSLDEGYFRVANVDGTPWWENEEVIDAGNGSVAYHWYVNRETGEWQPSGQQPTKSIVVTAGDFTQEFTIKYEATSGVTQLKTYINNTEVSEDAPYECTGCISEVAVTTKGLKNGEWIDVPVQALNYDTSDNVYYNFRFVGNCLEINRAGNATMTVSLKGETVSTTFKVVCNPVLATAMNVIVPATFAIAEWDAVPDQYVGIRPFSEGGYYIEFTPSNATNRDVTWTAQNPEIAEHYTTHSAGIVPKKAGTATFTVTNDEDSTLTQDVTVIFTYKNPLTTAVSGETSYTMDAGQTQELTITATPSNATEQRFDWTYSKDGIVSVTDKIKTSEDGLSYWTTHSIQALKAGTVTVTGTPWDTTGGCAPVTFTVTVNRDSSIDLESVTVKAGESVSYTDSTGDYSGAELTDLNTSVATIELESETATVAVGNIWTSSGGVNGGQVDISECLYTFTQNVDGSWTITGTDADGNTVYLYPGNGKDSGTDAGYPNTKNPPEGMTISFEDGYFTNSFRIKSSTDVWNEGVGAYLYFNSSEHTWNRSRTATTEDDQKRVSFFLFREAADGETSSATFPGTMKTIPGYVAVTSIDELTSGGEYLIAAVNEGWSQWYTAYPSAVTDSKYAQVAAVASGTKIVTNITITGVAAGKTSATIGSTEYAIKVVNDLSVLSSEWPSFRGNDKNNGVTSAATPRNAAETNEKWVRQISTSWSDAPSPMLLVDDTVVTMSGSTLYKLSTDTGVTVASAAMDAACSWGTTPPIYADGYIFCQLGDGKVQAFNAATLDSLWVYTDENGGQAQSPIAYSDGMVYVGFGFGNEYAFVCLDANDGELIWRDVDSQGYYWAGAVVVGDFVVCGTDGGSIISRNKWTGEVTGTLEVGNKIRSTICYDKVGSRIYFTDYAANLCYAQLNTTTGAMRNLTKVDCSAYGSYSTSTPVVYEGIAYIGVGDWSGNKSIVAVNVGGVDTDDSILWAIGEPAYPQCSVLLSTAYVEDDGYIYLYTTYNNYPGGINVIKAKADGTEAAQETLYTPDSDYQQYCICSVIAGSDGTLYYKNDSGTIFALAYQTPTYTVTLPAGEGYTVTGETEVTEGADYTFTVETQVGYEAGEDFTVKVNDEAITPDEDGSYTVASVSSDLVITVAGVEKIVWKPVTVSFSVSEDADFVTDKGNKAVALNEITVPYFDLALYGLEDFYFCKESYTSADELNGTAASAYGKITMLHLYIYATEVYYCGIDAEQAGQGYLKDSLGTNVFTISETSSAGHLFLEHFWGYDQNLNYYLNYEYPLASVGYGSTCDQTLLHDGDVVTVGHFSNSSFWTNSAKGFNFIETSNSEPAQGDKITLTLYRAGEGTNYTTVNTLITSGPKVYYALADSIASGNVTTWTELDAAGSDGTLIVDTSKLAPGEYIFAIAGQPGAGTTAICSTPGGVRVTVKEGQGSTGVVGDLNGDGEITSRDASMIYNIVNNNEEITDDLLAVADVNGDGDITARDAQLVYNYANGVITSFS
ncbi:MAG: Ig-like domain-containing protein [Faecousia sp.]